MARIEQERALEIRRQGGLTKQQLGYKTVGISGLVCLFEIFRLLYSSVTAAGRGENGLTNAIVAEAGMTLALGLVGVLAGAYIIIRNAK